jgi:Phosphoesterase family
MYTRKPCQNSAIICSIGIVLALSAPVGSFAADPVTQTPIRHIVVIFDENNSFDHYFGTYPYAANAPGEVPFHPLPGTPTVNGLSGPMLARNPNAARPFRLDRSEAVTCDMDHRYSAEQKAYNAGLMNQFVEATTEYASKEKNCDPKIVMGHYDGNTVTALWMYAQYFALADNMFATVFGPSTPGALNLFAGRIASPGMLLEKFPSMIGAAPPNRLGGAHGGNYQHGRAARGFVSGGGTLSVGAAVGEGTHSRRAVRHGGLASQACGARAWTTRHGDGGRGRGTALSPAQVRCNDQRRGDGALGGVGSGMR